MRNSQWEEVLPDALHSIRSLLCTTTNSTPHDRLFKFNRKSTSGRSLPSWVKPGPIYIRDRTRTHKNAPAVTEATLIHANPEYAHVQLPSGVQTTVNIKELARHPSSSHYESPNAEEDINNDTIESSVGNSGENTTITSEEINTNEPVDVNRNIQNVTNSNTDNSNNDKSDVNIPLRRSTRIRTAPKKFEDYEC